jgi:hypothetical protein
MPLTCLLNRLKEEPDNDVFDKLDVFGKYVDLHNYVPFSIDCFYSLKPLQIFFIIAFFFFFFWYHM